MSTRFQFLASLAAVLGICPKAKPTAPTLGTVLAVGPGERVLILGCDNCGRLRIVRTSGRAVMPTDAVAPEQIERDPNTIYVAVLVLDARPPDSGLYEFLLRDPHGRNIPVVRHCVIRIEEKHLRTWDSAETGKVYLQPTADWIKRRHIAAGSRANGLWTEARTL